MRTHEKEATYGFRVAHQSLADICHYCGDAATDRDHVQPLSHHEDMRADDSDLEFYCVPACKRCVEELSGAYTLDFTSRRQILASRVKRWPETQVLAEWTDEALEELGPNLRSAVQKKTAKEVWMLHAMRYDIFGAPERGGDASRVLVEYVAPGSRDTAGASALALSAARMRAA